MKKIFAIILCVVICAALTTTAFSAQVYDDAVAGKYDVEVYSGYLSEYPVLKDLPYTVVTNMHITVINNLPDEDYYILEESMSNMMREYMVTISNDDVNAIYVYEDICESSKGVYNVGTVKRYEYDPDIPELAELFNSLI